MFEKKCSKKGFTLLAVILMLLFIAAICAGLSEYNAQESRLVQLEQKRKLAIRSAFSAADIALARLQEIAGTDAVVTSPHPTNPNNPCAVAWNVSHPPAHFPEKVQADTPIPLISGTRNSESDELARLPYRDKNGKRISAPWEYVGDRLRFAYVILDESQKFPIVPGVQSTMLSRTNNRVDEQRKNQLINPDKNLQEKFSKARKQWDEESLKLAHYDPSQFFDKNVSDIINENTASVQTFGVIADWPRKRLKQDLSESDTESRFFPKGFFEKWHKQFPANTNDGIPVALSEAKRDGAFGLCCHIAPLIVDLKLHIGFFNPRTDGQHRARFHISAKLWNPYTFPILAHADGNLGLLDFSHLPVFFIQNKDTKGEFSIGLSEFPTGRFGLVRQTPSDETFNAHCKIFDATDQGFGEFSESPESGLHPGEVYLARFPDPRGQPEGLSRITGGPTWKFQKGNDPKKPPSKAVEGRWFHNQHQINIFSIPMLFPGEIVLRYYNGSFPQSMRPEDYSPEILKLKNISFPMVDFTISGKAYNRSKAGEYTISQANLVYRIRLKSENANLMKEFFENIDLRNAELDFSNPVVQKAFEITAHTGKEAHDLSVSEDDETKSYFFDRFENLHATEHETPAFSSIQIYDLPNRPQISVGTLRLFHQTKLPPHAIGRTSETIKREKINQVFDQYFFSSKINNEKIITSENHLFRNKKEKFSNKEFQISRNSKFAASCLIRGPFNINSTNKSAWKAIFANVFKNWKQYPCRSNLKTMPWDRESSPQNLKNVFFTRPFTAHSFSPDGKIQPLSDENLAKTSKRSREQFLLTQGLRSLPDEKISLLAESVSKQIQERLENREAFRSIAEFADSGILQEGIKKSKINKIAGEEIPTWFPGFLRQEHLLEALCLQASPRGDTFKIIARAEYINPITQLPESGANVEIIVQRYPDLFDDKQKAETSYEECNALNRRFGRRFKIVSKKILQN